MICIFSTSLDQSTTEVIRWLHYLGKKDVIRVNYNDRNIRICLDITEGQFSFKWNEKLVYLNDIEAVWYRKGKNWLCDQFFSVTVEDRASFTSYFNNKLKNEEARLTEYLHYIIENTVPALGSSTKGNLNKLVVLAMAKATGLLIPDFYITNYREGVEKVFRQLPDLITKSMSDGLYLFDTIEKSTGYFSYTEKLNKNGTTLLPEQISPSFLQKNIHKKYEVRVFFLENTCYSMAILSQNDEQTKTDYRKYNEKKPNRYVPYKLPRELDQKIKLLFKKLDLNTGSVDLMIDQQDNAYFLEINPVGQFGMLSDPCNYFLEKQVALHLLHHARTRTN
ncbi:grasp-with-spasm system ATP-grasp peptide maturase [Adhaeribacter radiodurans]|uniref:Grasp-with-spasm system ATP-grasp peptide maturase n=1 Tax=Adhaeribacter radiodurans TaxID=2745197 RepID=A0A7L7L5U6_9BACT|nr:grasp-with-spasm system ATP-grasp peptide maturase [Adhaeribacter radiodurans]QMU28192.1 grasp-with-spasm system ATP-grasp peptide maturase [Adhaeribacter radiodurans]